MACVLWLPLRGNLENYGTADVKIEGYNLTNDAFGILGSCYSFNGQDSYIRVTDNGGGLG